MKFGMLETTASDQRKFKPLYSTVFENSEWKLWFGKLCITLLLLISIQLYFYMMSQLLFFANCSKIICKKIQNKKIGKNKTEWFEKQKRKKNLHRKKVKSKSWKFGKTKTYGIKKKRDVS